MQRPADSGSAKAANSELRGLAGQGCKFAGPCSTMVDLNKTGYARTLTERTSMKQLASQRHAS